MHPGRFVLMQEHAMKFKLTSPKPRNRWAVMARLRTAGEHRRGTGGIRQRQKAAVRHALRDLKQSD